MELKDVLGKLGRLDVNELNATGQKHIELGECLVKLAETLQTLEAIELPSIQSEVDPDPLPFPEPEVTRVAGMRRWRKPKLTKLQIAQAMYERRAYQMTTDTLAKILGTSRQQVASVVALGKGEPLLRLDDGLVIAPSPWPIDGQKNATQPNKAKTRRAQKPPVALDEIRANSVQSAEFDEFLADKIHGLLVSDGSLPVEVIASRLGWSESEVASCCQCCEWFEKNQAGDVQIARV